MHLFIPDDRYTDPAYLQPQPGHFDAPVRFVYRPMAVLHVAEVKDWYESTNAEQFEERCHVELASRVTKWDLVGPDGALLPITPSNIASLPIRLQVTLFAVVSGFTYCDPFPDGSGVDRPGKLTSSESIEYAMARHHQRNPFYSLSAGRRSDFPANIGELVLLMFARPLDHISD